MISLVFLSLSSSLPSLPFPSFPPSLLLSLSTLKDLTHYMKRVLSRLEVLGSQWSDKLQTLGPSCNFLIVVKQSERLLCFSVIKLKYQHDWCIFIVIEMYLNPTLLLQGKNSDLKQR